MESSESTLDRLSRRNISFRQKDGGSTNYNTKQQWKQRKRQRNRFWLAKQQFRARITLFCTFLCHRCTTTTWNLLISRLVEDVNTRQWFSDSSFKPRYSPLEYYSRKIHQHLTNWTRRDLVKGRWILTQRGLIFLETQATRRWTLTCMQCCRRFAVLQDSFNSLSQYSNS